jgi:predicted RNase H-like nuclease
MQTQPLTPNDLLNAVKAMSFDELDWLVPQLDAIRRERQANNLSRAEARLLAQIKEGLLPAEVQRRYSELLEKQSLEMLTTEESRELLSLAQSAERLAAMRVMLMTQLAEMRKMPVAALIEEFGLEMQPYV